MKNKINLLLKIKICKLGKHNNINEMRSEKFFKQLLRLIKNISHINYKLKLIEKIF